MALAEKQTEGIKQGSVLHARLPLTGDISLAIIRMSSETHACSCMLTSRMRLAHTK